MGLDMYLLGKKYVPTFDYNNRDESKLFADNPQYGEILKVAELENIATKDLGVTLEVTVGYWRKANQIHGWFVDNVQDGEDDCGEYPVSRETLQNLRDLCKQAINSKDPDILPRVSGFFFGSNEVDDWYWEDLKQTIEIIDRVLSYPDDIRFYYQSSW